MKDNVEKITIRNMAFQLLKDSKNVLCLNEDDLNKRICQCIDVAAQFHEMFELVNACELFEGGERGGGYRHG